MFSSLDQRQWLSVIIFFSGVSIALITYIDGGPMPDDPPAASGDLAMEAGLRDTTIAAAPPAASTSAGGRGDSAFPPPAPTGEPVELPQLPEGPAARLLRGDTGPPAPAFGVGSPIPLGGIPTPSRSTAKPVFEPPSPRSAPTERGAGPSTVDNPEHGDDSDGGLRLGDLAPFPARAEPASDSPVSPVSPAKSDLRAPEAPTATKESESAASEARLRAIDSLPGVKVVEGLPKAPAAPAATTNGEPSSSPLAEPPPLPPATADALGPPVVEPRVATKGDSDSDSDDFAAPEEEGGLGGVFVQPAHIPEPDPSWVPVYEPVAVQPPPPPPVEVGRALPGSTPIAREPQPERHEVERPSPVESPACRRAMSLARLRMESRARALERAVEIARSQNAHIDDVAYRVRAHWHFANEAYTFAERLGSVASAYCDPGAPLPLPQHVMDVDPASTSLRERIAPVVAVFKNMKPKPAARILERWPPMLAATVLDELPARKAGPIAAAMQAPAAGRLTRDIAEGDTLSR